VEEFKEIDIVRFFSKVLLEEEVNCRFKHESIVDRNFANTRLRMRQKSLGDIRIGTNMVVHDG